MTSSRNDIARELRRLVEVDGEKELRRKGREFAQEIVEYAKSISPEDAADDNAVHYKDSFTLKARSGRGRLPSWRIDNRSPLKTVIEFGSGQGIDRPQGGNSPDHLVFTKTAFRYGGKVDGLGEDSEEL